MTIKKTVVSLSVAGIDISAKINQRLVQLTLNDNAGIEADTLDITLDDSKGDVNLPPHKAEISLSLGFEGEPMVDKGLFYVDETSYQGPNDQISITARSKNFTTGALPGKRSRTFKKTTVAEVVTQIAREHNLQPEISPALAGIRRTSLQQTAESDSNFLARLAEGLDATLAIKSQRLLFLEKDGVNTQGTPLPALTISREQTQSYSYNKKDKGLFTGVRAKWNNVSGGKLSYVLAGSDENTTELSETYASEQQAQQAANAELNKQQRNQSTFSTSLSTAIFAAIAGQPLVVQNIKPEINQAPWQIERLIHSVSASGSATTSVEAIIRLL